MNKKNIFKKVILFGGLFFIINSWVLSSCTKTNTCLTPKVVSLKGGFYQRNDTTYSDYLLNNANIYFGQNLHYFLNLKQTSKFRLTLSQNTNQSLLIFQVDSTDFSPNGLDSINILYDRKLHYISTACGYETFYEISHIEYTRNYIDTVLITHNEVNNNVNNEHLKIVMQ